ncbi:MAG: serine--tRNA ligase [Gammaproteobacteria bacterium]|nr:serine--tRNA ligase [Gammaproteobacteria bacterium]
MLDLKQVRQDPQAIATELRRRGFDFDVAAFEQLDARRKQADVQSQGLQAERKIASKKIGELIQGGLAVDAAKQTVNQTLEKISAQLDDLTGQARQVQEELDALMMGLPNLLAADVPAGNDEADNRELSRWGEPRQFDFEILDHVDVGLGLGGLDFETATKLTGSRFVVMRGPVARLHRALVQFMLNLHTGSHGYTEVNVPYIVNADSLRGTGQLPKFEEDLFKLHHDLDYYLIPTAEVPLTNMLRDCIVEAEEMEQGMRFVCHSPCFRSEAGSYGKDTRGMIRQHQFEKVELVQMVKPLQSEQALEELTGHAEAVLQALDLPYRKVILCAGDTSVNAHKTYDLEVWLPAQDTYREISSCSNFGTYQARRMKARWRNPETGKPELLHTLNGSGLAIGRTLVAVLENYQCADGSVQVPAALLPYMGDVSTLSPQ